MKILISPIILIYNKKKLSYWNDLCWKILMTWILISHIYFVHKIKTFKNIIYSQGSNQSWSAENLISKKKNARKYTWFFEEPNLSWKKYSFWLECTTSSGKLIFLLIILKIHMKSTFEKQNLIRLNKNKYLYLKLILLSVINKCVCWLVIMNHMR